MANEKAKPKGPTCWWLALDHLEGGLEVGIAGTKGGYEAVAYFKGMGVCRTHDVTPLSALIRALQMYIAIYK